MGRIQVLSYLGAPMGKTDHQAHPGDREYLTHILSIQGENLLAAKNCKQRDEISHFREADGKGGRSY